MAVEGPGAGGLRREAGGHRVQRVPANERRGRVHTSTVTVAVLSEGGPDANLPDIPKRDLRIDWFSGQGKGGQHRNRKRNCCRVTHLPSGMREVRQGRERERNLAQAVEALRRRLATGRRDAALGRQAASRRGQVGSGMRGDKAFTVRFQDNVAVRHATGARMRADLYMAGHMDRLW